MGSNPQTLQGGISLDVLKQDSALVNASDADKAAYLQQVYLPTTDPSFAKASDADKAAYTQHVLQSLKQAVSQPTPANPIQSQQNNPTVQSMLEQQHPILDTLSGRALNDAALSSLTLGGYQEQIQPHENAIQQFQRGVGHIGGGAITAIGLSPVLTPMGAGAFMGGVGELNNQLNQGKSLNQINPTSIMVNAATGGLMGAIPSAMGASMPTKLITGGLLGAGLGAANVGINQLLNQHQLNFKDPAYLQAILEGMGAGAAFGAMHQPQQAPAERPIGLTKMAAENKAALAKEAQQRELQTKIQNARQQQEQVNQTQAQLMEKATMNIGGSGNNGEPTLKAEISNEPKAVAPEDEEFETAKTIYHGLRSKNVNIRVAAKKLKKAVDDAAKGRVIRGRLVPFTKPEDIARQAKAERIQAHLEIYKEQVKANEKEEARKQVEAKREALKKAREIAKLKQKSIRESQKTVELFSNLIHGVVKDTLKPQKAQTGEIQAMGKDEYARMADQAKEYQALRAKIEKDQNLDQKTRNQLLTAIDQVMGKVTKQPSHFSTVTELQAAAKATGKDEYARMATEAQNHLNRQEKTLNAHIAKLEKLMQKDNPNVDAVLGTQFDLKTGKGQQKSVGALHYTLDQIEEEASQYNSVHQGWMKVIDEAMRKGLKVKINYIAEKNGHTSTYRHKEVSPYAWKVTKKGEVTFKAYNPDGHETTYHIRDTEGISKLIDKPEIVEGSKAFKGVESNVYHGPQEYNLHDVLSRPKRQDPVKDSDLQAMIEETRKTLENVGSEEGVSIKTLLQMGRKSQGIQRFMVKQHAGQLEASDVKQLSDEIKHQEPEEREETEKAVHCKQLSLFPNEKGK